MSTHEYKGTSSDTGAESVRKDEGKTLGMDTEQEKREERTSNTEDEREEIQQAVRVFMESLFRAGASLASIPVKMLPQVPREHFQAAGREITLGLSTLTRELAASLDKVAKEERTEAKR